MKLFPHQTEAIEVLKNKKRFLLADDQGLGKTAVAIHIALLRGCEKVLVLCPKSLILNWMNEVATWAPHTHFHGPEGGDFTFNEEYANRLVAVFNWDSLVVEKRFKQLVAVDWDLVIGDESHLAIKNWKAKRCKRFVFDVVSKAKSVLLMTGTPLTRSAADLHPTLSVLAPGKWGRYADFCEAFCQKKWTGFGSRGFEYFGFKNEEELQKRMSGLMLRRLKKDVLRDLPDKRYKTIPVSVDAEALADSLEVSVETVKHCIQNEAMPPGHLMSYLKSLGLSKVDSAVEYVSTLGVPTVVFAHHIEVVQRLREGLVKEGLRVGVIVGDTGVSERQEVVEAFQGGELDVVIGNLIAASTGITLTHSSDVVFVEYPWSPATFLQACDRVHRIGQKNGVLIHCLVAEATLEDVVLDSLISKSVGIDRVMGSEEKLDEALL